MPRNAILKSFCGSASSYSGIFSSPVKRAIGSVVSIAKKVIRRIRKKLENLCT